MNLNAFWQIVRGARSTLTIAVGLLFVNLGLFSGAPNWTTALLDTLQYDRQAVLDGQIWRLVTGNLVHWSPEHFVLDAGAFVLLGLIYERPLRGALARYCLVLSLAIGLSLLVFLPQLGIYRGLSGVDSGVFAAALVVEAALARGEPRRWLWLLPAAAIFVVKIAYECATGQLFFGTSALGELGLPVPLSHAAGALAAVAWSIYRTRLQANPSFWRLALRHVLSMRRVWVS
jgi:rhomboid family GlyGly-CTERM serine protease